MNRDDIIRMAREAGFDDYESSSLSGNSELDETLQVGEYPVGEAVFKFAALVAAAERERIKWNNIHSCHADCQNPACVIVREAVTAEREECAKVCDELAAQSDLAEAWISDCAAAIRARGSDA